MNKLTNMTIRLIIATLIGKVLGFAREISLTSLYGATSIADIYIIVMNIPLILFEVIGTAIGTAFIPLYYRVEKEKGKEDVVKFTSNITSLVIIICITLAIFGFLFSEQLVKVFAINFSGDKLDMSIKFIQIIIFSLLFIGVSKIITCWLQIKEEFVIPGLISVPYNIIIIISMFIASKGNLIILPIGSLLAILSQLLFQLPVAYKKGYRYKLYIDFKDEYIRKMIIMIIPVIIAVGVSQINVAVDKSLASTLEDGTITVLNSGYKLNDFIRGIFVMSLTSIIYPKLSKLSKSGDIDMFKETIYKSINLLSFILIPATIGTIVLAEPVVRIIFQRGEFDSYASSLTVIALRMYSLGLMGYGIRLVLEKVFFSLEDTKTPMRNGIVAVTINIVLNLALIKVMGFAGLAFSTSLSGIICVILLFRSLKDKIGNFYQGKIIVNILKCTISSILMGVVTHIVHINIIKVISGSLINDVITLGIAIIVGIIIYIILTAVLKVEETYYVLDLVKKLVFKGDQKIYE